MTRGCEGGLLMHCYNYAMVKLLSVCLFNCVNVLYMLKTDSATTKITQLCNISEWATNSTAW